MEPKQKYRITFKCSCGEVFKKITTNPDLMDASCPACCSKKKKTKFIRMGDGPVSTAGLSVEKAMQEYMKTPEFQRALLSKMMSPTPEKSKNNIKAVDETAKIVMEDYKMGDLKDTVHQGEAMAPKLQPHLQKQADSFFSGKKKNSMSGLNTAALARAAMGGAYRPSVTGGINPIQQQHQTRIRPPVNIIASTDGKA